MKFMKTQDKNTQIIVNRVRYNKTIKQLLPALAVNIIIVHPCDVVYPSGEQL